MSTTPSEYASFLVRLWRESGTDSSKTTARWHGEFEHIQTGRRLTFCSLDELMSQLRHQASDKGGKKSERFECSAPLD